MCNRIAYDIGQRFDAIARGYARAERADRIARRLATKGVPLAPGDPRCALVRFPPDPPPGFVTRELPPGAGRLALLTVPEPDPRLDATLINR